MKKVLMVYSTVDGQTLKICQRIEQLIEHQHQVTLLAVDDAQALEVAAFDQIVIGASIRYGKHNPAVYAFIKSHAAVIESMPNAFFSVNLVARKPGRDSAQGNPYVRKFLQQISWKPQRVAIFAGKLDYQKYSFWDRHIIRLIMWITGGPTDPAANIEYTDWNAVERFARLITES